MPRPTKAFHGLPMEGPIATWYTKLTARDSTRTLGVVDAISARLPKGARVLEVAPGPGAVAVELARRGYSVTGLDISSSFVRIAREAAARAGVTVDFQRGNASALPFADGSFEYLVCSAAFKNFTDPLGALKEARRVLTASGQASIYDLRKDATIEDIAQEVAGMGIGPVNRAVTRWTFRNILLRRAYGRAELERLAAQSGFTRFEVVTHGIGFELRLFREQATLPQAVAT